MLSRIRNANSAGLDKTFVPFTKVNFRILQILKDEGFIDSFDIVKKDGFSSNNQNLISVALKFKKGIRQRPYISFLKRVSKPGLRVYVNSDNLPTVWGGIGVAVF